MRPYHHILALIFVHFSLVKCEANLRFMPGPDNSGNTQNSGNAQSPPETPQDQNTQGDSMPSPQNSSAPTTQITNSLSITEFPGNLDDEEKFFKLIYPDQVNASANLIENYSLAGEGKGNANLISITGSGNGTYYIEFEADLYSGNLSLVIAQDNILLEGTATSYSGANVIPYFVSVPDVELELVMDESSSSIPEIRNFNLDLSHPSSQNIHVTIDISTDLEFGDQIILSGDSNIMVINSHQMNVLFPSGSDSASFSIHPNVNQNSNTVKFNLDLTRVEDMDSDILGYSSSPSEYNIYFISDNLMSREDELENSVAEGGALFLTLNNTLSSPPFTWSFATQNSGQDHSFSFDPLNKPSPTIEQITTISDNIYFIPGSQPGGVVINITDSSSQIEQISLEVIRQVEDVETEVETEFPDEFSGAQDFRMVGFPYEINDIKKFEEIINLGPMSDTNYLVYTYSKDDNDYFLINSPGSIHVPQLGLGYWMAMAVGGELEIEDRSPSDKEFISIDLTSEGWHLIGNPFAGNILLSEVYISDNNTFSSLDQQSTVDPIFYIYDPDENGTPTYVQSEVLDPFEAAWVYLNSTNSVTLTFAPSLNTITTDSSSKPKQFSKTEVVYREPPSPPQVSSNSGSGGGGGCLLGEKR